jgi:hypothetical protein
MTYANLLSSRGKFSFLNPGSYKPGLLKILAKTAAWATVNLSTVVPK